MRSQTLPLRERGFIESAKGLGLSDGHIMVREVLPNIAPYIAMNLLLAVTGGIYAEVGLFFLGVIPFQSNNWGVMLNLAFAGRVVEEASTGELLRHPRHPYTRALIRAIPRLTGDPKTAIALEGQPPALASIPMVGCVFRDRCPHRMAVCDTLAPSLQTDENFSHRFACHWEGASHD